MHAKAADRRSRGKLARRKLAAERHRCFITYRSLSTVLVVAGPSVVEISW
jgi:hypothetical protein